MKTKQIIRNLLAVLILGSLIIWAKREVSKSQEYSAAEGQAPPTEDTLPIIDGPQVIMTYFLSGTRCESCKTIEALSQETAETDFPNELASNQLIYRVVDTDKPTDHHYVKDYELTSKTVVLSRRLNGKENDWKDMDKVWDHLDDPQAFRTYLGEQVRAYLGS